MSRNDIRLRRKRMTSRRIERHKDYDALMSRYNRGNWARRMVKWIIVLIAILLAIYIGFFIL